MPSRKGTNCCDVESNRCNCALCCSPITNKRSPARAGAGLKYAQAQGYPQNLLSAYATETGVFCDEFFDPSNSSCFGNTTGNVICSVMGELASSSLILATLQGEVAFTEVEWPGSPAPACVTSPTGITKCDYDVHNNCTAATTPPDNDFTGRAVGDGDYRATATEISWRTMAPCARIKFFDGSHSAWECPLKALSWKTFQRL